MTDVGVIVWLQSFRTPLLDLLGRLITQLGQENFYIVAIPVIYWCIDPIFGYRLANVSLFSLWLNSWLKFSFNTPRPASDRIVALVEQRDPAFPSGHAQGTTAFWGFTALYWRSWPLAAVAVVVVGLVSLSRLYLGVHYPVDLLGGAMAGLLVLGVGYGSIRVWPKTLATPVPALAGTFLAGLGIMAVHRDPGVSTIVGALMGLGAGHILREGLVPYTPRASWWRQVIKVLLGVVVTLGLRVGLKANFPDLFAFNVLRYAVIGFVGTLVLPWAFVRLGLAPAGPGAGVGQGGDQRGAGRGMGDGG